MKKFVFIALFSLSLIPAFSQQSEVRQVGSFRGVKAGEAIDVYLKKGDKESVKVEVTGTALSNVLTEISGSYLRIHMKDGNYHNRNVKVYVTYVALERISASSAANIFSENVIKAGAMEISASSAATVEVSLDAQGLMLDVSSAGDIRLEGKTQKLEVEASSAGSIDAYNLVAENVTATASSAGSIKLTVTKEFQADASSAGSIRYRGTPMKTNTDSSSGGSVKKSN
ncbi:MAG TPA: head GIN domain-containing protein [Cyclobacteriaceae bacterium]|jgi:hypothetical protein|nr:head GIN domain-containing protein [Cyclobacteriaceae bacterium]